MSVEHRPLYRRRMERSLNHLRSRDRPTVGCDSIGNISVNRRSSIGKVSIDASADSRSTRKRNEDLLCSKPVKPGHYSVIRWHIFARSLDLIW